MLLLWEALEVSKPLRVRVPETCAERLPFPQEAEEVRPGTSAEEAARCCVVAAEEAEATR